MESIQIRKAELQDLPAIAQVNLSAFGNPSYPFSLRQNFDLFQDTYLVAYMEDLIVGFCLSAIKPQTDEGWVLDMGVLREHQGNGIGRALLERALELLRSRGINAAYLTVDPAKLGAKKLYESFGFEVHSEEKEYFGPGKHRLVMRCNL